MKAWIEDPVEPTTLLLAWQAPEGQRDRLRWAVGAIERQNGDVFRYFTGGELLAYNNGRALERLWAAGFAGYPAYPYEPGRCFDKDVIKTFLRRLPPFGRSDFARYQEYFSIRPGSVFTGPLLLALTEARLPSDGFSLVDPLDAAAEACDAVFEIAGYRYEAANRDLESGDELVLTPEPTNVHDRNAVAVDWAGSRVGFVNRLQAPTIAVWLATRAVTCHVLRKNGQVDAPRAYAKVSVRLRHSSFSGLSEGSAAIAVPPRERSAIHAD